MNDDIGKFGEDSMKQGGKKLQNKKTKSQRTFKVKFLTCNVFIF